MIFFFYDLTIRVEIRFKIKVRNAVEKAVKVLKMRELGIFLEFGL